MQCLLFFVHNLWRNYDFFSCIYIVFPLAFSVLFFKWNFWNLWKICGHGFEMLWLLWQQPMDPSARFLKRAGCVVGEGNEKDYLSGIVFPWALQLASVDMLEGWMKESRTLWKKIEMCMSPKVKRFPREKWSGRPGPSCPAVEQCSVLGQCTFPCVSSHAQHRAPVHWAIWKGRDRLAVKMDAVKSVLRFIFIYLFIYSILFDFCVFLMCYS